MSAQLSLFGQGPASFDAGFAGARRDELADGAWVELCGGWLRGHEEVFDVLRSGTRWQSEQREMYQRLVPVPRLTARFPEHGPGHPLLAEMARSLTVRYGQGLTQISAAYYRDGRDSVAMHGDRIGRHRHDCAVAIVSLGTPRRFLLKPVAGGASRVFHLGPGDLLIMGGSCQRTWHHGVPKVARAGPRISIQFRPVAR
jgi:alkylated DNA repair dioxygenase AlkB